MGVWQPLGSCLLGIMGSARAKPLEGLGRPGQAVLQGPAFGVMLC